MVYYYRCKLKITNGDVIMINVYKILMNNKSNNRDIKNQIVVVKSIIRTTKIYVHIVMKIKLLSMVFIMEFKDINVRMRIVEEHLIMI